MVNFNKSLVKLYFQFADLESKFVNLHVICKDQIISVAPGWLNKAEVSFWIDFPSDIKLQVSGKDQNCDTVVDKDGKIIADKHVKLTRVEVDHLMIPDYFLQKWPINDANNVTTYFGFNDTWKLELSHSNSFQWYYHVVTGKFSDTLVDLKVPEKKII